MCTVLLPPGVDPIAVNKYIYIYHIITSTVKTRNLYPSCYFWIPNTYRTRGIR